MHQWVRPRSLWLHLALLVVASGCLWAGWWQVHRAMAGNTLSYLYAIEWPAFAVVAGIGWWQMVHDTPEDLAERRAYHTRMRAASAAVVARTLPRSALAITVSSEDAGRRALGGGAGEGSAALPAETGAGGGSELVPAAPNIGAMAEATLIDSEEPGDEMTEYNRYLALLAVRGRPKTWRNPRGV
jgi:hypothetical protein